MYASGVGQVAPQTIRAVKSGDGESAALAVGAAGAADVANPTPSATANAPTRPTNLAVLVGVRHLSGKHNDQRFDIFIDAQLHKFEVCEVTVLVSSANADRVVLASAAPTRPLQLR
jgi:hypothetical protein